MRTSLTTDYTSDLMIINVMGQELSERDAIQFSNHGWIATIDWLHIQEFGKSQWKHSVKISSLHGVYNKEYCVFYDYW